MLKRHDQIFFFYVEVSTVHWYMFIRFKAVVVFLCHQERCSLLMCMPNDWGIVVEEIRMEVVDHRWKLLSVNGSEGAVISYA